MKEEYSSGGVVVKTDEDGVKILLIKDRFGFWTWPKGHVEKGETPEEAALREIAEETNISSTEILDEVAVHDYVFEKKSGKAHKTVKIFLVRAGSDEIIKAKVPEISKAKWFSVSEAFEKIDYEDAGDILQKALEILNKRS